LKYPRQYTEYEVQFLLTQLKKVEQSQLGPNLSRFDQGQTSSWVGPARRWSRAVLDWWLSRVGKNWWSSWVDPNQWTSWVDSSWRL